MKLEQEITEETETTERHFYEIWRVLILTVSFHV